MYTVMLQWAADIVENIEMTLHFKGFFFNPLALHNEFNNIYINETYC